MSDDRARRSSSSVPIFFPDWLLLSDLERDVSFALREFGRGTLLDLGCGSRPYERLKSGVKKWLGLDLNNPLADIQGPADDIPIGDATVDTVLCSQLLEHVPEPERVISECFRVLTPGGTLILSVPQYWPLHEEPWDFFRYTEFGLRDLLTKGGFSITAHRRQGCGIAVAGQAINNAVLCAGDTFSVKDEMWFKASKAPVYLIVNVLTSLFKPFLKTPRDVLNHVFIATKPRESFEAR